MRILFAKKEYLACIELIDNLDQKNLKAYYYVIIAQLPKSLIMTNQLDRARKEIKSIINYTKTDNTYKQGILDKLRTTFENFNKIIDIKNGLMTSGQIEEFKKSLINNKNTFERIWMLNNLKK